MRAGLAGSALDAHRPPPLSVHAEGEGEGGMPPAAAAGISPVITESPVAACGPPRSLPLRGRPAAQQSVAMRDSMALFLQVLALGPSAQSGPYHQQCLSMPAACLLFFIYGAA